jgi:hypothetical protein
MVDAPLPVGGQVGEVPWTVRPEWLAGRYWWRVVVNGHPKVLLHHLEFAVPVAEALAGDERKFRRQDHAAR